MADRDRSERKSLTDIDSGEIDAALSVLDSLAADDSPDPFGDGLADWARQPNAKTATPSNEVAVIIDRPLPEMSLTNGRRAAPTIDSLADTQPMDALHPADPESGPETAAPPTPAERAESGWLQTVPPLRPPATIESDGDWLRPLPPAGFAGMAEVLRDTSRGLSRANSAQTALAALEAANGPADLPDLTDLATVVEEAPEVAIEVTDDMIEPLSVRPPIPACLLN
jgi:hypothetical protein